MDQGRQSGLYNHSRLGEMAYSRPTLISQIPTELDWPIFVKVDLSVMGAG